MDDLDPYAPPEDAPRQKAINPYAPPQTDAAPNARGAFGGFGVWQQDGRAVMYLMGGMLPNRCAVCNAPGHHPVHRTFYWHSPWLYVLLFGGLLVYVVVAAIVRKSASVQYWLCDAHRTRRTIGFAIGWGGFVVCFMAMFQAAFRSSGELFVAAIAGMVVLPIAGGLMARMVRPTRIDDMTVWLAAGEPFVASLPHRPGMGAMGHGFGSPGPGASGYGAQGSHETPVW
jgi:hypothetical protein